MAAGIKADPLYRTHVEEWRKSLAAGFTDPEKIKDVYADVLTGKGTLAVIEAFQQGVFGRPEDFTAAMAFAKSFDDNKDRIKEVLGSGVASQILKDLDIRTKGKNEIGDPISGMSNEGYEATYDFRRIVQDWVIRHPEVSRQETDEAVTKIGKAIMDRFVEPDDTSIDDNGTGQTYERADDMGFDNPFTEGTAPIPQGNVNGGQLARRSAATNGLRRPSR